MSDVLFSVYTPTNDPQWLLETYQSLLNQTEQNWEWVLVPNGTRSQEIQAAIAQFGAGDQRVRVYPSRVTNSVGALKFQAVQQCRGKFLVELDHDDLLVENCFSEIRKASELYTRAGFFYSDWVGFTKDFTSYEHFTSDHGWESYVWDYMGKQMRVMSGFEADARSLCEIYYAPNHIRVWTREAYDRAGGYDIGLRVADDHDLMVRTYLAGVEFRQIQKPLYLYRIHDTNTVKLFNPDIQTNQKANRDKYLHDLILEQNRRELDLVVNIGDPFSDPRVITNNIGIYDLAQADYKLPFKNNTVGWLRMMDCLQLVPQSKVKGMIEEVYRVLTPGGWFSTASPSTDGRGAFQDLRHVSYWNENSWFYWTDRAYARHYYPVEDSYPRFQNVRAYTSAPTDWHRANNIYYVYSDLCALKGQRQPGYNGYLEG